MKYKSLQCYVISSSNVINIFTNIPLRNAKACTSLQFRFTHESKKLKNLLHVKADTIISVIQM